MCMYLQERHQALVQMGVSVETSGIKVEHGRYFLVNLNADPSLNELLVYYLKVRFCTRCLWNGRFFFRCFLLEV